MYEQECALYTFAQNTLSNGQWYERFNTKVDVGNAIGVTRQHRVLLEHQSQETHQQDFFALSVQEQADIRDKTEERYLSYIFLKQRGKQHNKLRMDLQNDFTTGDNHYPKNRQATLHLLDKYSKSTVVSTTPHQGSAFAQEGGQQGGRGGRGRDTRNNKPYDVAYWKDKECYKCKKKGHPANHCKSKTSSSDDRSVRSSRSSQSLSSQDLKKLRKDLKHSKKSFATLQDRIEELEDEDLTDSDESNEEDSHFQYGSETGFQMVQIVSDTYEPQDQITGVEQVFHQQFETRNQEALFNQKNKSKMNLDLRNVILLDSQSTMDLFCNPDMVHKISKSKKTIRLQSNGGSMLIDHKAAIDGYHLKVWFSKKAITNILALSNLTQQYRVTYDSNDRMFIVHREQEGKSNMHFKMHPSGLHYYDPCDTAVIMVSTVEGNKQGFTKRQIKGAEQARALYAKLGYPSIRDFKWVVQSNQIKDCPVTPQDIQVAHQIWGKDIAALKGKTTRKKSIHLVSDFVKIPKEILQMHREVFLSADIFFVNKIPFFLTYSRNFCFTAVNHLANRKVSSIFKAFEEIYKLYLNRGFQITVVHVDGEFAPLQSIIPAMPQGPKVNLASNSEHVPDAERRIRVVKERSRAVRHSLPFNKIPILLVIHIVFNCTKLLNHFPAKQGISASISPKTIMTGETLHYKKHLCLQVGEYVQVHEEDEPRNSQTQRTMGAICLGPSGNIQGGYKFMSLKTQRKVIRRNWDSIPMPDTVIARVNEIAKDQPELFTFTDRKGRAIVDVEIPGVDHGDEDEEVQGPENVEPELLPKVDLNDTETEETEALAEPLTIETPIEVETVNDDVEHVPVVPEEESRQEELPATPVEIPGVRR